MVGKDGKMGLICWIGQPKLTGWAHAAGVALFFFQLTRGIFSVGPSLVAHYKHRGSFLFIFCRLSHTLTVGNNGIPIPHSSPPAALSSDRHARTTNRSTKMARANSE